MATSQEHITRDRLDHLCLLVTDGTHDSPTLQPSGVPFIKGKHISRGFVDFDSCDYITYEDHIKAIQRSKPEYGNILFSNIGSVGDAAYINTHSEFSIKNVALFKPDPRVVDSKYLYYVVIGPKFKGELFAKRSGVAQPFFSLEMLRSHEVEYHHELPTQRKIAAILSAYDDLIEDNLRRIKILEEMAQNLYREWFVKFRFPGRQHARFTDSPLGRIPEGWEVNTVENTFAILGGGTPSKTVPEYWDEGTINWYSPTDLTATGSMFMERSGNQISELGLKKSSARLFPPFSVMMTSRATLGVISINTTEACTNQGFITCVPNERFPLYTLYYWLKENVEYFISLGTGATFKEITKGVFKTIELVVPAQAIVTQFEDTVQQFALHALNLQRKNTTLRRTRDLLLPKLISGEVDVSELDIAVSEESGA